MGLRDRLRARQLPTAEARIPVDPAAHSAAERHLEACARTLQLVQVRGDVDLGPYRAEVARAQEAFDAQPVETIRLRCLPPTEWEALVDGCPPTDDQRKQGWQWNVTSFRPALLAACVVPPEGEPALTEMDWRQLADEGQLAVGELELLFATAVSLNARQPQVSVGKGLSQTAS